MSARKARRRGGGPPRGGADTGRRLGRRWWAVAQMGFVIADGSGTIRVQRVDIYFGRRAGQMLEIVRQLTQRAATSPTPG